MRGVHDNAVSTLCARASKNRILDLASAIALSWRRHCSFAAHRLASPIAEVRDAERRMARAYVMFDNLGLCL